MPEAVIIEVIRTASGKGKPGGGLSAVHPVDLLASVLIDLVARTGISPDIIDDVIGGTVSQVGEQSLNLTRSAVLSAGFPEAIPATTIDRQCGSSQQAVAFAAQAIVAGTHDVVIACGVESMSRVPLGSSTQGADLHGDRLAVRYPEGLVGQGISAELIAARWKLSRTRLDEFSAASHARATQAQDAGHFARELSVVDTPSGPFTRDETIRSSTTVEALSSLQPSFREERYEKRFPQIDWSITPGNSSPLTDGASAALIMSADKAAQLGLRPRARVHSLAVVGSDPLYMLTGVIPATQKVLIKAGLSIDDIDTFEVNEAFAPVPLVFRAETGAPESKVNPWGGAIALGHALGSSGTRLLATMVNYLDATGGRYGLQTMCEGGGMANATIIERL
ncbi:thiolase family protein [Subtercola sp. PAMC28395]|uniref:thiolase family protein n=1 Tax=Subtercola sp. PAMC28395 TaxID=2846775 RepID=UPI001C0D0B43|nr:thiolase family protein [Subtercola sp. PAMC28395]QWT24498.1 thiolase family protein [Subtercola sp. PAMC28395]